MRDDVVKIIAGQKDLTHVFITTFNIDFIFIESVLLRELRKCGHPSLTIFADADQVEATFGVQGKWISRIGRRYRVVPVRVRPGFRFHPKAVLLSGAESAELLIGSGNLTFGGMRQNEEIWIKFDTRLDGAGPLAAFQNFAEACLQQVRLHGPARSELHEAFSIEQHAWAQALGTPTSVLFRIGDGPSMLDQIAGAVGAMEVQRIVISSPYFDESGDALVAIAERWPGVRIEVLVQQAQSQLLDSAWSRVRDPKSLVSIATSRGPDSRAFIHAKFYAFVGVNETVVCAGSANCSRAALTIPGSGGNAEILAVMRLPSGEFDNLVLSGVKIDAAPAVLSMELPAVPPVGSLPSIRILNAHHEHGDLVIAFVAPPAAQMFEILLDGQLLGTQEVQVEGELLRVHGTGAVSRVQVSGMVDGVRQVSPEHWVDHEFDLRATNRQRQIAHTIGENVAPGQWSFQGWQEILRLLGDYLKHTPTSHLQQDQRQKNGKLGSKPVAAGGFFTNDYRLPGHRHDDFLLDDRARVFGLRGLLLDYFGIDLEEDPKVEGGEEEGDDDTAVDRPAEEQTENRPKRRSPPKRDPTEDERRRGRRIAKQVVDILTSMEFIETRPSSMLASDLSIIAVLLVSGHAEKWLPDEDFLDLTYRTWSFLFFDDGREEKRHQCNCGALARRHAAAPLPSKFEESIRSVRLAAALATWCFCCPDRSSTAEAARFQVATRLAVARMPWLWLLEDRSAIEQELFKIASRTSWLGQNLSKRWSKVLDDWNRLFAEGKALAQFEQVVLSLEIEELRKLVTDVEVPKNTLLWQGSSVGFCILAKKAIRVGGHGQPVPVKTLRSKRRETELMPSFLLPFRSLLMVVGKQAKGRITSAQLETLAMFAARIQKALSE